MRNRRNLLCRALDLAARAAIRRTHATRLELDRIRFAALSRLAITESTDVFVASYPRSGTTLVQLIAYLPLSDVDETWKHLSDVSPSLESALLYQRFDGVGRPCVYKTHLPYGLTPAGSGRYIHIRRHGLDVSVSCYHHFRRRFNRYSRFEECFDQFLKPGGLYPHSCWFSHTSGWLRNKRHFAVLHVAFEDLVQSRASEIVKIARFLDRPVTDEKVRRICELTSLSSMRRDESRLDPIRAFGDPSVTHGAFIRSGRIGESREYVDTERLRRYQKLHRAHLSGVETRYFEMPCEEASCATTILPCASSENSALTL
jgi:hypothetical protein